MYLGNEDREFKKEPERILQRKKNTKKKERKKVKGVVTSTTAVYSIIDSENSEFSFQSDYDDILPNEKKNPI